MSDLKNIDDLIKNGLPKEYPVDEQLWSAAQKQLDVVYPIKAKKLGWVYAGVLLFLGVVTCLYFINSGSDSDLAKLQNANANKTSQLSLKKTKKSNQKSTIQFIENESSNKNKLPNSNNIEKISKVKSVRNTENVTIGVDKNQPTKTRANEPTKLDIITKEKDVLNQPSIAHSTKQELVKSTVLKKEEYFKPTLSHKLDMESLFQISSKAEISFPNQNRNPDLSEINNSIRNPLKINFFIGVSTGMAMNKSDIFISESANQSSINHQSVRQLSVRGGIVKQRFSASIGLGALTMNNNVLASRKQIQVIDTISSSYQLVKDNYTIDGKDVALIKQQFETKTTTDSKLRYDAITQNVRYWIIPLELAYRLPVKRFEVIAGVGADIWLSPKVTWQNFNDPHLSIDRNEFSPKQTVVLPNINLGLGYHFTSRLSGNAAWSKSYTASAILSDGGSRLNLMGLNFGLNYRL